MAIKSKFWCTIPKPENIGAAPQCRTNGQSMDLQTVLCLKFLLQKPMNGKNWYLILVPFLQILADVKYTQLVLRFNSSKDGAGDIIVMDNLD